VTAGDGPGDVSAAPLDVPARHSVRGPGLAISVTRSGSSLFLCSLLAGASFRIHLFSGLLAQEIGFAILYANVARQEQQETSSSRGLTSRAHFKGDKNINDTKKTYLIKVCFRAVRSLDCVLQGRIVVVFFFLRCYKEEYLNTGVRLTKKMKQFIQQLYCLCLL